MVGGKEIGAWLALFAACSNWGDSGLSIWTWPERGAVLDQASITVAAFLTLRDEFNRLRVEKARSSAAR